MVEYGCTMIVNGSPVISNSSIEDRGWRSFYGDTYRSSSGVNVSEWTALGYAPLWRAVNLIASDVAGMPCDIFKRQRDGGKKYAADHPAARLLRDMAAPWWRADEMRKTLTAHALIHGNGYGPISRDMNGDPVAIGLMDPTNMMIRVLDSGEKWYVTYVNGEPVKIPARDMIHIKGLGRDGLCGYRVIDLMRNALGVGMAAQEFGGRLFSQGANMSGLLMVPGHFSEERIRNTMSAWDTMQTGLNKAHKVALLQDGVKFQQLSIAPEQAQFLQTREFEVRQTVSNITGVPPHMLGDSTRTSHSSLESESQSYLSRCLNPWLKEWEQELRCKLLTDKQREKDSHVIEFNRESVVEMSFESKITGIYRQIESGTLNRNEARAILNLPSLGEDGDEYYHPANWVVAGEEDDMAESQQGMSGQPAQPPEEDLEEDDTETETETTALLRAMITSNVTDAIKIERDRVVQRAGMKAGQFVESVSEFYTTWTANTVAGLTSSEARLCVISHAEESKRLLMDVHGVSTTASLKANVLDVVQSWDNRAAGLIENLMKTVKK